MTRAAPRPPCLRPFSLRRLSSVNALSLFSSLFSHLLAQYRRRTVFLFSLYVILGNSVLELLLNYDLSLWYALDPAFDLNGLVLACGWLLSAAAAFLTSLALVVTYVDVHPYLVLSALPALASLLVWASTWTSSVHVACVLFVSFYAVLSFLMVVSSALIASAMSFQAFAFLFSVNTFLSLARAIAGAAHHRRARLLDEHLRQVPHVWVAAPPAQRSVRRARHPREHATQHRTKSQRHLIDGRVHTRTLLTTHIDAHCTAC